MISVLIVNYRSAIYLNALIESLNNSVSDFNELKIFVRNNDRGEEILVDELTKKNRNVNVIHGDNIGFGRAINQLASTAQSEFILIVNPDCKLMSGSVGLLLNDFLSLESSNKKIGLLGAALVDQGHRHECSYGNLPTAVGLAVLNTGLSRFLPKSVRSRLVLDVYEEIDRVKRVSYPSGAFLLVRTNVFISFGGFDPDYFAYFEEAQLAKNMSDCGYEHYVTPNVKVLHHRGNRNPLSTNGVLFIQSMYIYAKKNKISIKLVFFTAIFGLLLRSYKIGLFNSQKLFEQHKKEFYKWK